MGQIVYLNRPVELAPTRICQPFLRTWAKSYASNSLSSLAQVVCFNYLVETGPSRIYFNCYTERGPSRVFQPYGWTSPKANISTYFRTWAKSYISTIMSCLRKRQLDETRAILGWLMLATTIPCQGPEGWKHFRNFLGRDSGHSFDSHSTQNLPGKRRTMDGGGTEQLINEQNHVQMGVEMGVILYD